MAPRLTNIEQVLDPWIESEPDPDRVDSVVRALMDALDNYDELWRQPAILGHPLKRLIEVPEADVLITVLLPNPFRGIHLLSIAAL